MNTIRGLREYVEEKSYREALGLPRKVEEEYRLLAQGEYNRNYIFAHPVSGKKLILRVNCGSQMHLDNQIQYEYDTLKLLEGSGRTPLPFYVDGSLERIPYGIMVMEFLPGHGLDYRRELTYGAECLADIHSVKVENTHLLRPRDPIEAILQECEEMAEIYMASDLGKAGVKKKIRRMLDQGWEKWRSISVQNICGCCVNTELNSTNFLINGEGERNYLIDWEKPIYGDPAQDLGHFLAPTTTFWKTDVLLTRREMDEFIDSYLKNVDGRFHTHGLRERTYAYIPVTCLRGISWCAMAWIEYQQPDKLLFNQSTCKKLENYLEESFLDYLEQQICR